uniref:Uncharacterized protein n=1 Tax=Plectus sambesii TaxID=2011161 RepID=A0A914ULK6_9BILA
MRKAENVAVVRSTAPLACIIDALRPRRLFVSAPPIRFATARRRNTARTLYSTSLDAPKHFCCRRIRPCLSTFQLIWRRYLRANGCGRPAIDCVWPERAQNAKSAADSEAIIVARPPTHSPTTTNSQRAQPPTTESIMASRIGDHRRSPTRTQAQTELRETAAKPLLIKTKRTTASPDRSRRVATDAPKEAPTPKGAQGVACPSSATH